MKLSFLLLLTFWQLVDSITPPFPVFGPCQRRCIKQYGETRELTTNIDTKFNELDVHNKTEFSLCKLGCNSPGYTDLHLPAFRFGQSAYQEIVSNAAELPTRMNIVKEVNFLCLDRNPDFRNSTKRELSGKVILALYDEVNPIENVHFMEVVARNIEYEKNEEDNIVFQDWCYSSNCNVTFNLPTDISTLQVRVRLSTFDENGPVGGIVLSKWYNMKQLLLINQMDIQLLNVAWRNDKASAMFSFDQESSLMIPFCSMQIMYKDDFSPDYKKLSFQMDHTHRYMLKNLDFKQSYTVTLSNNISSAHPLARTSFNVPPCREMVNDWTQCAPPPVSDITSNWNSTADKVYPLTIGWSYFTDRNVSFLDPTSAVSMSHFNVQLNPLIDSKNERCELLEPIRRDVTWTHRKVTFYVTEGNCNYEVEIYAMDTKQRKSDVKKIKIFPVSSPLYMGLLSNDFPRSVGLGIVACLILATMVIITTVYLHRKKNNKKIEDMPYDHNRRNVYAYVDPEAPNRTIIGIHTVMPGEQGTLSLKNFAMGNDRFYSYNLATQMQKSINNSDPYAKQLNKIVLRNMRGLRGSQSIVSPASLEDEHPYEVITDYHVESEASDGAFEDDIISSPSASLNGAANNPIVELPKIAPFEDYKFLPAVVFQDLQQTQVHDVETNRPWRMLSVVDLLRGGSFGLKYAANNSEDVKNAMVVELNMLSRIPPHLNCLKFEGIVIGRWNAAPYNVIGLLFENCRGGTLNRYLKRVGSHIRCSVFGMEHGEQQHPIRSEVSPSPPSSGYDSLKRDQNAPAPPNVPLPDVKKDRSYFSISLRLCQFAEQVAAALEHLHSVGIVHTRVTTMSMYLHREYSDPLDMLCDQMVKLGDFGNAASNADDVIVDQNLQPPEVALGRKYEAKGDIWQFGTCLVEMCTLGVPYLVRKDLPNSGIDHFDLLPSTKVLSEAAKRCLNTRNRPSASDLRAALQTDSARDLKAMDLANLEKINQSLLV